MKYNPHIHHRRAIRLHGYDYSQSGAYFITICCYRKECHFGKITAGYEAQMVMNEFGQLAYDEWIKLPNRFPNVELDVFQIMPNHMHGIILLTDSAERQNNVGAGFTPALLQSKTTKSTISDIVGANKSLVSNNCLEIYKSQSEGMGKLWQRNFHDHIIRNDQSYQMISNYIVSNPANWETDKFYKP